MSWRNPIPSPLIVPEVGHPGAFGTQRKFDFHTGVDLYADAGTPVTAVEPGIVVAVIAFTGPEAESPWWLPTSAVLIEGASGVVLYGEIKTALKVGNAVPTGGFIGHVERVLRNDKGKPTCMLHLELYKSGTTDAVWWKSGDQPEALLDPTPFLKEAQ